MQQNKRLVLQAQEIFVDSNQYDEYELVGCYRLIALLCKKMKIRPQWPMLISDIQQHLKTLDRRLYNIVRLRCWKCCTRDEIGLIFSISRERVRQLEERAQKHLYALICRKEIDDLEQPIEVLDLDTRGYYGLKHVGVQTIGDLLKAFEQEIFEIKGIGPSVACDIGKKLKAFMLRNDSTGQEDFEKLPIDFLRFSNAVRRALKNKGIYTVRQFRLLPLEEAYKIKLIGEKGFNEVMKKKQELETILCADSVIKEPTCLTELDLGPRAMRCIRLMGVKTIKEFCSLTKKQVLNIWHVGEKTWQEIYEKQQSL